MSGWWLNCMPGNVPSVKRAVLNEIARSVPVPPNSRREPEAAHEHARHVALVGKARADGRFRQAEALTDQASRAIGTALQQPIVRCGAIRFLERSQQLELAQARQAGQ